MFGEKNEHSASPSVKALYIDAHAHLDKYTDEELPAVLQELEHEKVFAISAAMDIPAFIRAKKIAKQCSFILPIFGIHPWNAPALTNHLNVLDQYMMDSPLIGEIGLDFFFIKDQGLYPAQRLVFEYFLNHAKSQKKIVELHTKGAEENVLSLLNQYRIRPSIVHWYSGPINILKKFIDRGDYFSIGIELLHSSHIEDIARLIPADRILTETDAPGGPRSITGIAGRPIQVKDVILRLAEIRHCSAIELEESIRSNMYQLFLSDSRLSTLSPLFSPSAASF